MGRRPLPPKAPPPGAAAPGPRSRRRRGPGPTQGTPHRAHGRNPDAEANPGDTRGRPLPDPWGLRPLPRRPHRPRGSRPSRGSGTQPRACQGRGPIALPGPRLRPSQDGGTQPRVRAPKALPGAHPAEPGGESGASGAEPREAPGRPPGPGPPPSWAAGRSPTGRPIGVRGAAPVREGAGWGKNPFYPTRVKRTARPPFLGMAIDRREADVTSRVSVTIWPSAPSL